MVSLIGVVISNRDYGPRLPGLFASLAAQTVGLQRVACVFADDASSDGSLEKARALGSALPFARFEARAVGPLGHPARTRNAGFDLAGAADPLLFLDADDLLLPRYLEACLEALERGAQVVACDYEERSPEDSRIVRLADFDPALLRTQNILGIGSMMRREVFLALEGFRDHSDYEDWDFWVRAAHGGFRFARVPEALYVHMRHGVGFSSRAEARDGRAKAAIVAATPGFFPPETRRWAKALLEGKPWAQPLARGVIPREEDVRALRDAWAALRTARARREG
ncbi:hypothetical protein NNJEOMEG_02321 [Fundidesulfovibrio magnetotacticus]|uniref:Glycosyltransferase 2-like domain-containing protein n=1 Tax=Fundidesulfovibrio magnetotacticus TaxID=2730080 RepID=A0A6V8LXE4_9BACT|nr:glycosyltransferase family A protein [Fundidesulfovibrio magnetotacticus]GFK94476.1 hypothetical protein NNJEOMEG_02321 [Fundidesulfovibrio magnetotacticus]